MNRDLNLHFSDRTILKYLYASDHYPSGIANIRKLFNDYKRIDVLMFHAYEDLMRYIGQMVPSWVIATYFGRAILVLDYEIWKSRQCGDLNQIITHELVHVFVSKYKVKVPVWLNEGLAQYLAGQLDNRQVGQDDVMLRNIYDLNYDSIDVYEVSGWIITKLINTYGLPAIIARVPTVVDFRTDAFFGEKSINSLLKRAEI